MNRLKEFCIKDRTIKFPCLATFALIFLGLTCTVSRVAVAEEVTYECENFTALVTMKSSQGEICPECNSCCPVCPPVLVCDEGYTKTCVKDDIPPPGERQQYPPSVAAAWVASLGCSNLTDVALNDSRWSDREVGEVFIQESDKCISIYWPSGGEALFDLSATLSNPAEWNDYKLSQTNGNPGGGNYTIGSGKEKIRFNDGGTGGMTVFVAGPTPPPTGDFLQYYQNPEYEAMPANAKHRLYPMGGVMPIAYWGYMAKSEISRLAANGFTAYGVDFGNDQTEAKKDRAGFAGKAGLRHITNVYGGTRTSNFTDMCKDGKFDNGSKEQGVIDRVGREITAYIAEPRWNDYIDMWFVTPEETGIRMDHHSKDCGRTAAGRFIKSARLKINEVDPQNRPMVNSDLSGTSVSEYQFINRYREQYTVQIYSGKRFKKGSHDDGWPTSMIQVDIRQGREAADGQQFDSAVPTTRKQFVSPLIGTYYKLQHVANTPANWESYMGYMVSTAMIYGAKGYQIYHWMMPVDGSNADKEASRTGVINFTKKFTSLGFDKAMLWGKRMKGEKNAVVVSYTGPDNADFAGYKADAFAYQDVQYERCRYLMFTNSHWSELVSVNLSGLPVGMKMVDFKSGVKSAIINSTMNFDISNEGYRAIKIMPISGKCEK